MEDPPPIHTQALSKDSYPLVLHFCCYSGIPEVIKLQRGVFELGLRLHFMVGGICGKAAHPNRITTAHLTILQRAKRER